MVEPGWWGDPDASQERRALIEAFRVDDLEAATAELRTRCERLELARSRGEIVTVGEVAEVLLGQWAVAFYATLADSQRAFVAAADHGRLARAAQDGRAAAVAVRDRYLGSERISPRALQTALDVASADAAKYKPDRADALSLGRAGLSERAQHAVDAWEIVAECRRRYAASGDGFYAAVGLLAHQRAVELAGQLPAGERAAISAHIDAAQRDWDIERPRGGLDAAVARLSADQRERELARTWDDGPDRRRPAGRGMTL